MSLVQKKSKGLAITTNTFIWGVVILVGIAFLVWFFVSRYVEIDNTIKDETSKRETFNLLNYIISSPEFAYIDEDGKLYRGVIDTSKLGRIMVTKDEFNNDLDNIGLTVTNISYPNSIYILRILDLEDNDGWIGFFISDVFEDKYRDDIDLDDIKNQILTLLSSGCDPFEWDYHSQSVSCKPICNQPFEDIYETGGKDANFYDGYASSKGLPIILLYRKDGKVETHVGRIVLCLITFGYKLGAE